MAVILYFPSTTVLLNKDVDRVSVEKQSHAGLNRSMMKWRLRLIVISLMPSVQQSGFIHYPLNKSFIHSQFAIYWGE